MAASGHPDDLLAAARPLIRLALQEDLGSGDLTTEACVPPGARGRARILAKRPTVACGLFLAGEVFGALSEEVRCRELVPEGAAVRGGRDLLHLEGPLAALLGGERVVLNLLGRLCGIAAWTRRFRRAAGPRVQLLDTRKTTPGMRVLEKYAVRTGGGTNHRVGLWDRILIKENHVAAAGGIVEALARARSHARGRPVQIEVRTLEELVLALEAGADSILLDNMDLDRLRDAVRLAGGRCPLEASGGVDLRSIAAVAATGVDRVSVGALTHSSPHADLSMLVLQDGREP
ncbi:MAG: carboxylating nicotinate-nucleotide diphosphorylase [Deltaproteobacteria bacterium]|nr:carboxylating nicotinate-nucleotide diphosphorylase [Deltaproteobacteria bacterium]